MRYFFRWLHDKNNIPYVILGFLSVLSILSRLWLMLP